MPLKRHELTFLRDIIWARLAGTGIHLIEDAEGKSHGRISYRGHRIWGIKSLIVHMTDDVFNFVLSKVPIEEAIGPESLASMLAELAPRYDVDHEFFSQKVQALVGDPHFWSSMDDLQRFSFIIAAFFEALDDTRVKLAEETLKITSSLPFSKIHPSTFPKLVKNLGFAFRAREYAFLFNQVCDDGYAKIVRRANKALAKEYRAHVQERTEPMVTQVIAEEGGDFERLVSQLRSAKDEEVLTAIEALKTYGMKAVDPLETLLHHKNEEIASKALDVILELKEVRHEDLVVH